MTASPTDSPSKDDEQTLSALRIEGRERARNQPLLYADETLECLGIAHTTQRISIEKAPGGKIMLEARFNNARCP